MVDLIIFLSFVIGFFALWLFLDGGIPDHIRAKKKAAKAKRAEKEAIKKAPKKAPEKATEKANDDQSVNEWRKCPGYGIGTSDCFCCDWNGSGKPPCY